ncbi:hypothetical protein QNN00_14990 [Bacillus velezensis]|nr:hypothetical protein [Bacillus velezensis]
MQTPRHSRQDFYAVNHTETESIPSGIVRKEFVEIILTGDTFDDAYKSSAECCEKENRTFIHPFDDPDVMAGQGTAPSKF